MRSARVIPMLAALLLAGRAVADPIIIPSNTWIAVPYPPSRTACDFGACKHERLAHNSIDGRIYWLGGDHNNGPDYTQSGSNEVWSYSISGNDWSLETAYCLPPGYVQPAHPDEVGFAFDSRRNQFWMYPGYMGVTGPCQSIEIGRKAMVMNVASGLWSDPNLPWDAFNVRFSQYDPVGDRTLSFEYAGDLVVEHKLSTGALRRVPTIIPPGEDGGNAFITSTYTALDPVGQKMYVIATSKGKLYRYDLVTNEFRFMTTTPIAGLPEEQMLFWDGVNQVLLWPYRRPRGADDIAGPIRLFVWHAATNVWNEIPVTAPVDMQGNPVLDSNGNPVEVKGRQGVFDPFQRVMLITGTDAVDYVPYLFLYRYAEGPPDTAAPSAPADLHPR